MDHCPVSRQGETFCPTCMDQWRSAATAVLQSLSGKHSLNEPPIAVILLYILAMQCSGKALKAVQPHASDFGQAIGTIIVSLKNTGTKFVMARGPILASGPQPLMRDPMWVSMWVTLDSRMGAACVHKRFRITFSGYPGHGSLDTYWSPYWRPYWRPYWFN